MCESLVVHSTYSPTPSQYHLTIISQTLRCSLKLYMFLLCRVAVLHNILTICCKKEGLIVLSISACMCTVRCEITYSCIHVSSLKAWRGTFF